MSHYHPFKLILRSMRNFYRDQGPTYAASLAYFFIVAVVPLILFTVTIFGYLLGESQEFITYFVDELIALFPSITVEITNELKRLITFKGLGAASLIIYAMVSFQLYRAMYLSMQAIFKVIDRRPFYLNILFSFGVVCVFVFLMFVSFSASTMVPLLAAMDPYIPIIEMGSFVSFLVRYVFPLALVTLTAIFMYIVIPRRRIRFFHAFWGGLFTAVMLEAAKHLFTWYVLNVRNLGAVYGSLSAFVVFLLWIYFSSSIFLLGGEIVHNLTDPTPRVPVRRSSDIEGPRRQTDRQSTAPGDIE
jgi:membrane protein